MVIARFVEPETGYEVVKESGYDWMEALDKAYSKLMKIDPRPRVHIKFEFVD